MVYCDDSEMSEALLEYKVERVPGEGYIASCMMEPKISVFHKEDGSDLAKGIHNATRLYVLSHPTTDNDDIRNNNFEMKRVE